MAGGLGKLGDLTIDVSVDTSKLGQALRQIEQDAAKVGRTVEQSLGAGAREARGLTQAATGTRAALGGIVPVASTLRSILPVAFTATVIRTWGKEVGDAQRAAAALNATLISTGRSTEFARGELDSMADAISRLTGVDDELITDAEKILLRFDEIGRDVFPRVLSTSVDLAAAIGSDIPSAARLLGGALQDPVNGARRLNTEFRLLNAAERDSIKQMIDTGKVAEAQAVILGLVESKVRGQAQAYRTVLPGALQAAQTALGNFFEQAGDPGLVDLLNGVATAIDSVNEAMKRWGITAKDFLPFTTIGRIAGGIGQQIGQRTEAEIISRGVTGGDVRLRSEVEVREAQSRASAGLGAPPTFRAGEPVATTPRGEGILAEARAVAESNRRLTDEIMGRTRPDTPGVAGRVEGTEIPPRIEPAPAFVPLTQSSIFAQTLMADEEAAQKEAEAMRKVMSERAGFVEEELDNQARSQVEAARDEWNLRARLADDERNRDEQSRAETEERLHQARLTFGIPSDRVRDAGEQGRFDVRRLMAEEQEARAPQRELLQGRIESAEERFLRAGGERTRDGGLTFRTIGDEERKDLEAMIESISRLRSEMDTLGEPSGPLAAAQARFEEMANTGVDSFAMIESAVESWGQKLTDTLVDAAMTGELSFKQLADSIIRDMLRIQIQRNITQPLTDFLQDPTFWAGFLAEKGAAFDSGRVLPFARGGIVNGPTFFPMADGAGLMGEAGPEAVLPLKRLHGGELGVRADLGMPIAQGDGGGVSVTIEDRRGADAPAIEQRRDPSGKGIRLIVRDAFSESVSRGELDGVLGRNFGLSRSPVGR
ncbi:MAG: hypothetical protein A3E78_14185 [Alphaproteobacteria bacterium RIFCSPHIGHO2_12_FULL_63_12]|nr:MAG: hypothetical protein A3E78_14185 [Alphaproteobacteria bacterium RIFCSPHIGHO2_12_FULL_63_12]